MLITLWNSFRGYVIVKVTGFSVERFMNMAVHKGIYIWDVKYYEDCVTMKVSIKAFKMLKTCAKKTKCRMKIVEKKGCPFLLFRYRNRKFLVAGFFFFIASLYALSMFIWLVDIKGAERINPQDVMVFCMQQDVRTGVFKHKVNTKAIETMLMKKFPDIAWVNVYIKGTRATISIKETIPKQVIVDRKTPCDIVAKKDALIVSIATSTGTPYVKEGDVVHKDDILVKGEIVVKKDEVVIIKDEVHADSVIVGKLYYDINFHVPYEYFEKQYTKETKKLYTLQLFGKNYSIPHTKMKFESFDKSVSRKQLSFGEDYPLPIILITDTYKEYVPVKKYYTKEACEELANKMITGRIIREFDFEADIVEKNVEFVENDTGLVVKSIITTYENIGEEKLIDRTNEDGDTQ